MAKGIAIILTFVMLGAALLIINTYMTTSMAATSAGVNLSESPAEVQDAYNASQRSAVATVTVSHYIVYMVGIFAVIISLVVLMMMAQSNKAKSIR